MGFALLSAYEIKTFTTQSVCEFLEMLLSFRHDVTVRDSSTAKEIADEEATSPINDFVLVS